MVVNWEREWDIGPRKHQRRLSQAHSRCCTQTKLNTRSAYTRVENRLILCNSNRTFIIYSLITIAKELLNLIAL